MGKPRPTPIPGSLDEHMTEVLIWDVIQDGMSPGRVKELRPELSQLVDRLVRQGGPTPGSIYIPGLPENEQPGPQTVQPPTVVGATADAAGAIAATSSPAVVAAIAASLAAAVDIPSRIRPALENLLTRLEADQAVAVAAQADCKRLLQEFRERLKEERERAGGIGIPRSKSPGEPDCTMENSRVREGHTAIRQVMDLLKP